MNAAGQGLSGTVSESRRRSRVTVPSNSWLLLLLALWLIMLHTIWNGPERSASPTVEHLPALSAVNPNTAPWWELAMLRRVGFGLAHEIVDYRRSVAAVRGLNYDPPAFWHPSDLQKIRGIGPKTIAVIADELCFTERPPRR